MTFIESSNNDFLVLNKEKYYLNIKTVYEDNNVVEPKIINLNITIIKIIDNQRFYAETLELIYNLKTRMYSVLSKIGNLSSLLYDSIITKLNNAFGYQWGYENQYADLSYNLK